VPSVVKAFDFVFASAFGFAFASASAFGFASNLQKL
jgi:hypothetical protein